jgi:hypothetical protein
VGGSRAVRRDRRQGCVLCRRLGGFMLLDVIAYVYEYC